MGSGKGRYSAGDQGQKAARGSHAMPPATGVEGGQCSSRCASRSWRGKPSKDADAGWAFRNYPKPVKPRGTSTDSRGRGRHAETLKATGNDPLGPQGRELLGGVSDEKLRSGQAPRRPRAEKVEAGPGHNEVL